MWLVRFRVSRNPTEYFTAYRVRSRVVAIDRAVFKLPLRAERTFSKAIKQFSTLSKAIRTLQAKKRMMAKISADAVKRRISIINLLTYTAFPRRRSQIAKLTHMPLYMYTYQLCVSVNTPLQNSIKELQFHPHYFHISYDIMSHVN